MQIERFIASVAAMARLVLTVTCRPCSASRLPNVLKCSLEDAQGSLAVAPCRRQLHGLASQLVVLKTKAPVNFIGAGHTQACQVPKTEVVSTTSQAKHKRLWVGVGAAQSVTSRVSAGTGVVEQVVLASVRPFQCVDLRNTANVETAELCQRPP
jgi:hypothetical protein